MLLTVSYSKSAYPITPVEPLKASLYYYTGISVYFVYFIYIYKDKIYIYVCMYVLTSPPRLLNRIQPNFACPLEVTMAP